MLWHGEVCNVLRCSVILTLVCVVVVVVVVVP